MLQQYSHHSWKRLKGFTLFEMIIVMFIIGTLISAVSLVAGSVRTKAKEEAEVAELSNVIKALEDYKSRCRTYPLNLSDANNGLKGVSGGKCLGIKKYSELLPKNYTMPTNIVYYPMVKSYVNDKSRCSSYILGLKFSANSSVVKKSKNDVKLSDEIEGFVGCDKGDKLDSLKLDEYYIVKPPIPS